MATKTLYWTVGVFLLAAAVACPANAETSPTSACDTASSDQGAASDDGTQAQESTNATPDGEHPGKAKGHEKRNATQSEREEESGAASNATSEPTQEEEQCGSPSPASAPANSSPAAPLSSGSSSNESCDMVTVGILKGAPFVDVQVHEHCIPLGRALHLPTLPFLGS